MYTKVELLRWDPALNVVTQFGNVGRLVRSKAPKSGRGCFRRLHEWAPAGYYMAGCPVGAYRRLTLAGRGIPTLIHLY